MCLCVGAMYNVMWSVYIGAYTCTKRRMVAYTDVLRRHMNRWASEENEERG